MTPQSRISLCACVRTKHSASQRHSQPSSSCRGLTFFIGGPTAAFFPIWAENDRTNWAQNDRLSMSSFFYCCLGRQRADYPGLVHFVFATGQTATGLSKTNRCIFFLLLLGQQRSNYLCVHVRVRACLRACVRARARARACTEHCTGQRHSQPSSPARGLILFYRTDRRPLFFDRGGDRHTDLFLVPGRQRPDYPGLIGATFFVAAGGEIKVPYMCLNASPQSSSSQNYGIAHKAYDPGHRGPKLKK